MKNPEDWTGLDISVYPGAVRAVKKNIPVAVRFAARAGVLHTLEGPVRYAPGDALLTGEEGEEWAIRKERFLRAYTPEPPTEAGRDGWYVKKQLQVWALRMRKNFYVRLGGSGCVLHGAPGDWLVQYGRNDYGIVRSDIFAASYECEGN